jgi:hypothetical protein
MSYILDSHSSKCNALLHGYKTQEIIKRVTKSTNRISANLTQIREVKLNGTHHLITISAHVDRIYTRYKLLRGSYHDTMEGQSDVERIIKYHFTHP